LIKTLILIFLGILVTNAGPKKDINKFLQSHILTLGRYYQYQKEDNPVDESLDLEMNSEFIFPQLIFTSYLYYSHNLTDGSKSDIDDPIFTVSSTPRNLIELLKMRYYLVSSLGISKLSRDIQEQYGTIGMGIGLDLDNTFLKTPALELVASTSLSKGFRRTRYNADGVSNNDYYLRTDLTASYKKRAWRFTGHFRFYQYFKYISDESSEIFYQYQDVGYMFLKNQEFGIGHSNRMPFYDENSGEVNVRVVNPESSYFYIRYSFYL
jgi:hypothetical protein